MKPYHYTMVLAFFMLGAFVGSMTDSRNDPSKTPVAANVNPSVKLEFATGTDLWCWFKGKNFGPHGDYPGIKSVEVDYQYQNPQEIVECP